MADLTGQRVAIAGMGVSGLALGKAVKQLGGEPTVFDQKQNDTPAVLQAVDRLDAFGVPAVTGWHGRLDPAEYDVLVVSPGFPRDHPAIRDMLARGRPIWSEIEFAYRIAKAPILAITGTNGKSTTTVMLWQILQQAGRKAVLCGNIAGSGYPEMPLTQAALSAGEGDLLVAEVSSYHLEWVEQFRPKVAAVTNITPDHMDRYAGLEDYGSTKLRIFGAQQQGDFAVVNLDEPSVPVQTVQQSLGGPATLVGFSPSGKHEGTGSTRRNGDTLWLSGMEARISDLPLGGEHNVTNAMMAWEMASCVETLDSNAARAVHNFRGLSNRMERLGSRNGIAVVNNSMCTNPAAVVASCRSLSGKLHILIGGLTKNLDFAPVGEFLRETGHRAYVFGPEPQKMASMLGTPEPFYPDLPSAFLAATESARPGDTVILAPGCASADPYANFKERGDAFKSMASEWLGGSL